MLKVLALTMVLRLALPPTASFAASLNDEPDLIGERSIGYVLTGASWAIFQSSDGGSECPEGFNAGPRERFAVLFPDGGSVEDTQLQRESHTRYPEDEVDSFPYRYAGGQIAPGLDLDGRADADDFRTSEGLAGIDNQLFRAIGCTRLFRAPDGTFAHFANRWVREMSFNRVLIEVENLDSLANDDEVTVTIYRGKDPLVTDASGDMIIAGGSNRIDKRFSARFHHVLKGRVHGGVLTTEPADVVWPWAVFLARPGEFYIRGFRLQLDISAASARGYIGGYADVGSWYDQIARSWSAHYASYGDLYSPSLFAALRRLADGYPDAAGTMTAISSAIAVEFSQVFIDREN